MKKIDISAIVCTYNRCDSLKDTLDSLLNQKIDGNFNYEVIVVDNNSKDKTKEVVEGYKSKFNEKLRYLLELKQGKPSALNRGIHEAKGEVVAFVDDDVIVDKEWLLHIINAFRTFNCDGVGGKVLPNWKVKPPSWVTNKFLPVLAIKDYGDEVFYFPRNKYEEINGSNSAFKKELFKKYGLFNIYLKRSQDSEIFRRFLSKGSRLLYYPNSIVFHTINQDRLNKNFFKSWYFKTAQNHYLMNNKYSILFIVLSLIHRFVSYLYCFLKQKKEDGMYHEIKIYFYLGLLKAKMLDLKKKIVFRSRLNNLKI